MQRMKPRSEKIESLDIEDYQDYLVEALGEGTLESFRGLLSELSIDISDEELIKVEGDSWEKAVLYNITIGGRILSIKISGIEGISGSNIVALDFAYADSFNEDPTNIDIYHEHRSSKSGLEVSGETVDGNAAGQALVQLSESILFNSDSILLIEPSDELRRRLYRWAFRPLLQKLDLPENSEVKSRFEHTLSESEKTLQQEAAALWGEV